MINVLIHEKLSQLYAIRRQLQDHENTVEITLVRQQWQQEISKIKQKLQADMWQYQGAVCGQQQSKKLHSSTVKTNRTTDRTGNIVSGESRPDH